LGQLMGLAIRSRELLSLDLPSIVWKSLISDKITEGDVLAIDRLSWKMIENLRDIEKKVDAETFDQTFADTNFVIIGSDGKEYPLVPGGRSKRLRWDNRDEYIRSVVEYRKNEFSAACQAMRRGLATVVPYSVLSLFTWMEIERFVCGLPTMDVDLLIKMTTYQDCTPQDPHIQNFWTIIKSRFDDLERAKFLKFVWGRSRLPLKAAEFETKFKIHHLPAAKANPDAFLPVAHTCFFSLDLPAYSTLEVMRQRLLYAITHCEAIDTDFTSATAGNLDDDPDSDQDDDE